MAGPRFRARWLEGVADGTIDTVRAADDVVEYSAHDMTAGTNAVRSYTSDAAAAALEDTPSVDGLRIVHFKTGGSIAWQFFAYVKTTDDDSVIIDCEDSPWAAIAGRTLSVPTAAAIRAEMDSNSTQLQAIADDTNELQLNQGNWLTATGFAVAGDAMALTSGERTTLAGVLEAAILNEGDATALLAAIAAKVEEFLINDGDATATLAAIAAAVVAAIGNGSALTEAGGTGDHLSALPWNAAWDAEVQSEVQDAIEANHLDHLLAADYNPASKPGVSTALLNELVENDGGVSRFTANALEQGPSGGGGSQAGTGSRQLDWTILVGAVTVSQCAVWISTDSPFTTLGVFAGTLYSDDSGLVSFMLDEDVTYYGWRKHPNYNFAQPWQFRYSSGDAQWQYWDGAAWQEWT